MNKWRHPAEFASISLPSQASSLAGMKILSEQVSQVDLCLFKVSLNLLYLFRFAYLGPKGGESPALGSIHKKLTQS